MPFSIPVAGATLLWSVKCQHTDWRFSFQENDPADGVLTVHTALDDAFRAEFVSLNASLKYEAATEFDDSTWVGEPYSDLIFFEKRGSQFHVTDSIQARFRETQDPEGRRIVSDYLDSDTVGQVYRVHNAVRTLQLAYRKKAAARAFREAMAACGALTPDAVECVIAKLAG